MAHHNEDLNYGKKGSCFAMVIVGIILFVIMLIWIYNKNGEMIG